MTESVRKSPLWLATGTVDFKEAFLTALVFVLLVTGPYLSGKVGRDVISHAPYPYEGTEIDVRQPDPCSTGQHESKCAEYISAIIFGKE